MKLSKIKLAGFKSFVDPTTVPIPSNLVGVVGPNGCGKSNVIDAVRWVLGESSAKHLRGDSMADVIFNGSASRKPVGAATVELFFDNSDGTIGGQYANYSEIAIKRTVVRDGTSQYFLNNTRCRRKDITSLFMGTGLGPRSYAIIEQGMVSRLIEAKPEEMRGFIEEAAGISRYKERRKETENRIRHTRDNLDRLNDLREEVESQIKYLGRQAKMAERYKKYKEQERRLDAEFQAIRLIALGADLDKQQLALAGCQTALEAAVAEQRAAETNILNAREIQTQAQETCSKAQGTHYSIQSEVASLEQSIQHGSELRERQDRDLTLAKQQLTVIREEIVKDRAQLDALQATLEQLAPDLDRARELETLSVENLKSADAAIEAWQGAWHEFNLEAKEVQQISHLERARIEHLEERLSALTKQREALQGEQQEISLSRLEDQVAVQLAKEQQALDKVTQLRKHLEDIDARISRLKNEDQSTSQQFEQARGDLESRRGHLEALKALQKAALGQTEENVTQWLARESLDGQSRLAQKLVVEQPWVLAVESVLGDFLQAVCVQRCEDHLGRLPESDLVLIGNTDTHAERSQDDRYLCSKVKHAGSAAAVLASVRIADSLEKAISLVSGLAPGESVITMEGIWLGDGWVRVGRGQSESSGVISREQDIRNLQEAVRDYELQATGFEETRHRIRQQLEELEQSQAETHLQANEANGHYASATTMLNGLRQDFERIKERLSSLNSDSASVADEIERIEGQAREAKEKYQQAVASFERLEERRPLLHRQKEELLEAYNRANKAADKDRISVSAINVEFERRTVSKESASSTLERISVQQGQLEERVSGLTGQLEAGENPLKEMQQELNVALEKEVSAKQALSEHQRDMELADEQLRMHETGRADCERAVGEAREVAEQSRMQVRELEVRREGVAEQFTLTGLVLETVINELDENASDEAWEDELATVRRRIERLGSINMAAIDQFNEQSERKLYLDSQFDDLNAALDTLQGAIRKIDRETRTRFKETFDNVNSGLQRIFPRLFGGGHAYLGLEGDDVLDAGVTVMAQPPGKRNSSIHLLSGGEKALTAVALIFSIFELNPAPFCLLDEVDAPLDDANVARFCEIVREMSETIQFVVITHNKMTMEMVSQLTGVTMHEAGVSRLVSVDIDAAVKLVAV